MKLRWTRLLFILILMLLSPTAYLAADQDIYSFTIAPPGDEYSVIGKKGEFTLIHNTEHNASHVYRIHQKSEARLEAAAFSPNSEWLALGASDGSILRYKISGLFTISEPISTSHEYGIAAVTFSPDGETLVVGGKDDSLFLLQKGSSVPFFPRLENETFGGIKVLTFSPDGKTLAIGTADGKITLWDTESWRSKTTFAKKGSWDITALAFSPNGKTLASGTSGSELTLWDPVRYEELISPKEGHNGKINALVFSPDSQTLASGADDKRVLFWSTQSGKKLGEISTYKGEVLSIVFSVDGKTLVAGEKTGKITRADASKFVIPEQHPQPAIAEQERPNRSTGISRAQQMGTKPPVPEEKKQSSPVQKRAPLYAKKAPPNSKPVYSIAFVPADDNRSYILGQRKAFSVLLPEKEGRAISLNADYDREVISAAVSRSLQYAVVRSSDPYVWLSNLLDNSDPTGLHNQSPAKVVTFTPNGEMLAVGTTEKGVLFWDVSSRKLREDVPKIPGSIETLAFSPDSRILAVGQPNRTLQLWDIAGKTHLKNLGSNVEDVIGALAFSPDNRTLAVGKEINSDIELWNISSAQKPSFLEGHTGSVHTVAFSPDGKTLAAGAGDGKVLLWDVQTETKIDPLLRYTEQNPQFKETGHEASVLSVAFSRDGGTLKSGDATGSVLFWDLSTIGINPSGALILADNQQQVSEENNRGDGTSARNSEQSVVDTQQKTAPMETDNSREQKSDKMRPQIDVDGDYPRTVDSAKRTATITGSIVDDTGVADAKIEGREIQQEIELSPTDSVRKSSFREEISLEEGDNEFTITATDVSGKESDPEVITIYREPTPPEITVMNPPLDANNSARIWRNSIEIVVQVTDESGIAEFKLDGATYRAYREFTGGKEYRIQNSVTAMPATFEYTITARDNRGSDTASKTFKIIYAKDETAPTIEPKLPGESFTTEQAYIHAKVTDAQTGIRSVKVEGQEVSLGPEGEISHPVQLREGANTFRITAADKEGNENAEEITLHRTPAPPEIKLMFPAPNADNKNSFTIQEGEDRFNVSVLVEDDSEIATVKINEEIVTSQDGRIFRKVVQTSNLKTVDGLKTLKVYAEDVVGEKNTGSFTVNFKKPPAATPSATTRPVDKPGERSPTPPTASTPEITPKETTPNQEEEKDPVVTFLNSDLANDRPYSTSEESFLLSVVVVEDSEIPDGVKIERESENRHREPVGTAAKIGEIEYEIRLRLHEGENKFVITVEDKWYNSTTEPFTIVKHRADSEGPDITFTQVGAHAGPFAENAIVVSEEKVLIRGSVTDATGVASVQVNGQPISFQPDGSGFETSVPLDYGKNQVTFIATDTQGIPKEHPLTIYQQFDRTGKDFALFFATDTYTGKKDDTGNWQNLKTPIHEAEVISKNLEENYGFKTKVFKNLPKRELLDKLYIYGKDFEGAEYVPGSQLLIFFSGHGYYDNRRNKGYLIAADTNYHEAGRVPSTAISLSDLRDEINLMVCKRVLVLLDTCDSGTFDPNFAPLSPMRGDEVSHQKTLLERLKVELSLEARWCLTAAGKEYVTDGGTGYSPFAAAFLKALNTKGNADSVLTLDEVWKEIEKSKEASVYNELIQAYKAKGIDLPRPQPRKGQFGVSQGDFLFFPRVK